MIMPNGLHKQLEITQARLKELREEFGDDELVRISSIANLERMEERLKEEIEICVTSSSTKM